MNTVTPLEMIVVQLRKWDRKGYLKNRPRPDLQTSSAGAKLTVVEVETRHGKDLPIRIGRDADRFRHVCGRVSGILRYFQGHMDGERNI